MAIPKSNRSGGPKTASGKVAASKNAVTHGSYANQNTLSRMPLAREDFESFTTAFIEDLKPHGQMQNFVARQIASEAWRMRHLTAYEQSGLDALAEFIPSARELHDEIGLDWSDALIPLLEEHLVGLQEQVENDPLLGLLEDLKSYFQEGHLSKLKEHNEDLYWWAVTVFCETKHSGYKYEADAVNCFDRIDQIGKVALTELFPEAQLKAAQIREWIVNNQPLVEAARQRCISKRVIQAVTDQNLLRARTTINKTLFALMDEYRRLQKESHNHMLPLIPKTD